MPQDTLIYDTLNARPLPEWLIKQQQAETTGQQEKIIIAEDHSLNNSVAITAVILIIGVVSATIFIKRKYRKR